MERQLGIAGEEGKGYLSQAAGNEGEYQRKKKAPER